MLPTITIRGSYSCSEFEILGKENSNSDGQQFHQYQQFEQTPPNSDGQQIHHYQENEQSQS